ncbi:MAG: S24/S26 family peptidase [Planctomycetes bacterium]|nr:S24/S26 family peptidase [Planctomycetota bacterium]
MGEPFLVGFRGGSMAPTIPDGATLEVFPVGDADRIEGEVVLFSRGGSLTTHRCIADLGGWLLERGDAGGPVGAVPRGSVEGIVRRFCRGATDGGGDWEEVRRPALPARSRALARVHRALRSCGAARLPFARPVARAVWRRLLA